MDWTRAYGEISGLIDRLEEDQKIQAQTIEECQRRLLEDAEEIGRLRSEQ